MRDLDAVGGNGWIEAELLAPPAMRAGDGADVTLALRSSLPSVEGVDVAVHGLAGVHLGLPAGRVVLRPGVVRRMTVRLQLPTKATPGHHPLVLELRRQLDPDITKLVPFEVEVLAAPVPVVALNSLTIRRRGKVRVENPSDESIRVTLTGSVNGAAFRFKPTVLDLDPGGAGKARLRVTSRSRFGRRPATVRAATANATASVDAVVVGRSRSGPFVAAFVAVAALVGAVVWAAGNSIGDADPDADNAAAVADRDGEGDAGADGGGGTTATADAGSTTDGRGPAGEPGAAVTPGSGTSGPAGSPGTGGAPGAPVGDCATADGLAGWALRGRVIGDFGTAAVVARPAGMPVELATTTTTDDAGAFSICPLELGDYLVTVLSEGYYPLVVPARLAGASTDLGELELEPGAATLIGTVTGPAGPVEGATVLVRVRSREVGRAITDAAGEYLVIGVPSPADIVVEVSAPGFAPATFTGEVLTDGRIRQPETHLTPE